MNCPYHALSEFLRGASLYHREGRNSGFIDLLGDVPNSKCWLPRWGQFGKKKCSINMFIYLIIDQQQWLLLAHELGITSLINTSSVKRSRPNLLSLSLLLLLMPFFFFFLFYWWPFVFPDPNGFDRVTFVMGILICLCGVNVKCFFPSDMFKVWH